MLRHSVIPFAVLAPHPLTLGSLRQPLFLLALKKPRAQTGVAECTEFVCFKESVVTHTKWKGLDVTLGRAVLKRINTK